jgi:hypothetical protein
VRIRQYVSPPIHTFCMGQAASMGSLLLAAGAPGHRYCLPNASVMIHRSSPRLPFHPPSFHRSLRTILCVEPSGGASGQATDISIHAKEILRIRELLTDIYAEHCSVAEEERVQAKDRFGEFALSGGLGCWMKADWEGRESAGEGSFYDGAGGVGVWACGSDCAEAREGSQKGGAVRREACCLSD